LRNDRKILHILQRIRIRLRTCPFLCTTSELFANFPQNTAKRRLLA
jgi:hypothetical protein